MILSILKHFEFYVVDNDIKFATNFLLYLIHIIDLMYFFLKLLNKGMINRFNIETIINIFIFNF